MGNSPDGFETSSVSRCVFVKSHVLRCHEQIAPELTRCVFAGTRLVLIEGKFQFVVVQIVLELRCMFRGVGIVRGDRQLASRVPKMLFSASPALTEAFVLCAA